MNIIETQETQAQAPDWVISLAGSTPRFHAADRTVAAARAVAEKVHTLSDLAQILRLSSSEDELEELASYLEYSDIEYMVATLFDAGEIKAEEYYKITDNLPNDYVLLENGDVCHTDDACFVEHPRRHEGYHHIDNATWCEEESIWALDDYVICHGGEYYTESYYHDNFACCECCGSTFRNHELDSNGRCEDCHKEPACVKTYGADVLDYLPFGERDGRFCGVEWETERGDYDDIGEALEEDAILKEDGSLDDGAEIVSRPLSLKDTLAFLEEAHEAAVSNGCIWSSNCGFHVHLERSGLRFRTIDLMQFFVMSKQNRPAMEKIAGRRSSHYAELGKANTFPYCQESRREGFNRHPSDTVEFRLFTGKLNLEARKQNVVFCHAVADYCQAITPQADDTKNADIPALLTLPLFIAWLESQEDKPLYKAHADWLVKRLA